MGASGTDSGGGGRSESGAHILLGEFAHRIVFLLKTRYRPLSVAARVMISVGRVLLHSLIQGWLCQSAPTLTSKFEPKPNSAY